MSKYAPLQNHLINLNKDSWKAKFSEIEDILGFSLPESARAYPAWWANNRQGSRHTKIWLDAGWQTADVNFGNKTITFQKSGKPVTTAPKTRTAPPAEFWPWDKPCAMEYRIVMEWQPLGKISVDQHDRILFPKAPNIPAIYRFRIRYTKREATYIGETDNLSRRFSNYRNPGSTQQTSLRINAVLKEALDMGAEISISAVMTKASVDRGKGLETVSLSSKAMRCLFENAAILDSGGTDIDVLNRSA